MRKQEKTFPLKCRDDYYVVQANELIRSQQDDLTLLEAKLIRLAIAQILETDTAFKTYTCSVAELADFLGISRSNVYAEVDNLTTDIMKKIIKITGEKDENGYESWIKFHWVSTAKYHNGEITIRLSDELMPYLLGLNELFTSYAYSEIIALPTVYAIRLFELLVSYQDMMKKQEEITFTAEYLREYFDCIEKYPNTSDFIRRVIEPAVKAIQQKTIMQVEYRKITKRRTITGLAFRTSPYVNHELPNGTNGAT